MKATLALSAMLFALVSSSGFGATADGVNVPAFAPLVSLQQAATGFGNSAGGSQDSPGGSELDALHGIISGSSLQLGITGNLEGNFNKMFIFIDSVSGGENTLLNDNVDGGFNEINNMAGLTFDTGFEPDYAIRIEVGGGFNGINFANLNANSAVNWNAGGGPGSLPLSRVAANNSAGTVIGWDNSNGLGVDGASAAGAATATTGWEFDLSIGDLGSAGPMPICVMALIVSADGGFLSNQLLPSLPAGTGNLGGPGSVNLNQYPGDQFACIVPEPATLGVLLVGVVGLVRRRR